MKSEINILIIYFYPNSYLYLHRFFLPQQPTWFYFLLWTPLRLLLPHLLLHGSILPPPPSQPKPRKTHFRLTPILRFVIPLRRRSRLKVGRARKIDLTKMYHLPLLVSQIKARAWRSNDATPRSGWVRFEGLASGLRWRLLLLLLECRLRLLLLRLVNVLVFNFREFCSYFSLSFFSWDGKVWILTNACVIFLSILLKVESLCCFRVYGI